MGEGNMKDQDPLNPLSTKPKRKSKRLSKSHVERLALFMEVRWGWALFPSVVRMICLEFLTVGL
jgi:hypothetical protein